MPPMRRVNFHWMAFHWMALIFAVGIASAQSFSSPSLFSSSLAPAGEASSNPFHLDSSSFNPDAAARALSLASASGGGGKSGVRHHLFDSFAMDLGAGFNGPIGNDKPYITWGGNLTAGAGVHFNKRFSLLAEYQFIDDKLPGAFVAAGGGTSGDAHIWSFTLDPVIDLFPKRTYSAYVTGGGGFYRKVTSFTVDVCCDFYGYEVPELANHFSSNQGGLNFGIGATRRLGGVYGDGTMKLFGEVRYLDVKTPEFNAFTGPVPVGATELIPVTFGVRW
jgi:hypothetical protein